MLCKFRKNTVSPYTYPTLTPLRRIALLLRLLQDLLNKPAKPTRRPGLMLRGLLVWRCRASRGAAAPAVPRFRVFVSHAKREGTTEDRAVWVADVPPRAQGGRAPRGATVLLGRCASGSERERR